MTLQLVMRWLHLTGVIVAVGGTVFVRFVLLPVLGRLEPATAQRVGQDVTRRFVPILHTAILAIIISGFYNFLTLTPAAPEEWQHWYSLWFWTKVALALVIFTFAVLVTSRSPGLSGFRSKRSVVLLLNVILAGTVIAISAYLRTLR